MDVVTYALSRKYTDKSIEGISGTLSGKNCTIASIEQVEGGNLVTFEWYSDEGESQTSTMFVQDGVLGEDAIAPTYDPTQTYNEGDLVVFENELYKLGAGTTTGEFNPNVWDLTNIENLLNTKVNSNDLSTVATSGSYNDLSDTPTIPDAQIQSDWNQTNTNAKDYIKNKPSIPEDAADISYDNTSSGLEADNAQDAIDEVLETAGKVDDIVSHGQSLVTNKISDLSSLTALGTASGDIASFSDGANLPMPTLKIGIEPQQDLHGYDAPWVGGSGKNKLPNILNTITKNGITVTKNSNGTYTVNGTCTSDNTDFYINAENGASVVDDRIQLQNGNYKLSGISDGTSSTYRLIAVVYNPTTSYISLYSGEVSFTIENNVSCAIFLRVMSGQTFNNFIISPMIRLATETDATFEPYSNICPISGHTEANVSVVGKNLFDRDSIRRGVYTKADGTTQSGSATTNFSSQFIKVKPNTIYSITMFEESYENGSLFGVYYDENKNGLNQFTNILKLVSNESKTFTTPSNAYYIVFTGYRGSGTDIFTTANTMVCEGTPTTYEPYNGNTYNIQFKDGDNPLTVYGGTLDVVSGELVVDRAYVDLGTLTWGYISSDGRSLFTSNDITDYKHTGSNNIPVNAICECFKIVPMGATFVNGQIGMDGDNVRNRTIICDNRYLKASDFKTAMNGVQLVYELATPTTIQLTPTQVNSLLQQNNVWADCGEIIEAKYCRDLTTIIDYILEQFNA